MFFNSIDFALFLPIVFFFYWFVTNKNLKIQNVLLVIASYVFYGWWDWRFLSLIIISSFVDYWVGLKLAASQKSSQRKLLLFISIFINIGFLAFFKYYNFFAESFASAFTLFGHSFQPSTLKIILPVGISFYTFQTLSYSIDVYRRKLEPTRSIVAFFAFVSFFPQLVAGPIERATNLLPQFYTPRQFEYAKAVDGLKQILWGLFKKVVIADNCANYVNAVFENYPQYPGSTLLIGAVLFAFQIYGDFSGYSDIAIGTARLFGFNLMRNFNYPYFSRDIAEFWRRWHISLSTWFRDYLYIPLGGSRGNIFFKIRNTLIIFLVSGLWHGANWTFVLWGALNALYFLPLLLLNRNRVHLDQAGENKIWPSMGELLQILTTFILTTLAWVVFRAESLSHALGYFSQMFSSSLFMMPASIAHPFTNGISLKVLMGILILFVLIEWIQKDKPHALQMDPQKIPIPLQWAFFYMIGLLVLLYPSNQHEFIYFQF